MKHFSQDLIFEIIKNNALSLNKEEREYGQISHFFEDYPYVDFKDIQQKAINEGFHVERACDIKSEDPHYKNVWENENAIIIFYNENML